MSPMKKPWPRLVIVSLGAASAALLMAAFLAQCAARAEAQERRIVSAGGVITEIAYALKREDWLVGVDTTSQHPPDALKSKPSIGYVRALSAEGLLSLKPDRVIAVEGAGPPDVMRLIAEAKVPITFVPEDYSEEGVVRRIIQVGEALEARDAAAVLAEKVRAGFVTLADERIRHPRKPRALFVLSLQNGRVMVGGRNTSADAIIRLAGADNVAGMIEGFKPLSDEGIIAAAPEIIIMMKRGDHAVPATELFAHAAFQLVPAAKNQALVTMDGLYLLGFGPRTPDAARDLMREIMRLSSMQAQKRAASGALPTRP